MSIIFNILEKNAKDLLQLETPRLYGPVVFIPRYTAGSFQRLNIRGKEYIIPPNTNVILNCGALHTLPSYWGADSLVWRPSRWLDERKRSFNLHLVGIILGQQDRGSAQGRSSHK